MDPATLIVLSVLAISVAVALVWFGTVLTYLATAMRQLGGEISDLTIRIEGMPQKLHGIVPALQGIADSLPKHAVQVGALVGVVAQASASAPTAADKPEPFDEKAANWEMNGIPQDPFKEGDAD